MKLAPLLLAALLAGACVVALAPAAESTAPACTFAKTDCEGAACVGGPVDRCFLPRPEDIPIPCKDHMCVLP